MDTQYSHIRRKGEVELQLIHVVSAVVCSWHRWCSLADALVSKHPATSLVHHPDANFLNSSSIFATFVMSWIGYDKLVNQTCHNDEVKIFDFILHPSSTISISFHLYLSAVITAVLIIRVLWPQTCRLPQPSTFPFTLPPRKYYSAVFFGTGRGSKVLPALPPVSLYWTHTLWYNLFLRCL